MKVYSADLLYGNPTDAPELILEIGELGKRNCLRIYDSEY
jgi:hypothetical protein